jgi:hypothetical protein
MTTATVSHLIDAEGSGTCQECQRDGLRWIVVLTDGAHLGMECTKRVLGYAVPRKAVQPLAGLTVTETAVRHGETWTLYADDRRYVATRGTVAMCSGPAAGASAAFARYTA